MEYYIDFFSNYNNSYIFMAMLTTFCNFSFFLLNQNNIKYPSECSDYPASEGPGTTRRAAALQSKGGDLVEPAGGEETDSEYENSSGSSSNRETSDLDYEPSFEESGHETSSCSSSEGSEEESEGGVDSEYKQSNEYSSICDSLTSSLCHPCFKKTSPMAPSGSYLEESQLSDFYSNSSFYSIDSEDEEKIKKIKLKMRSLKLKIKNIKLSALNKSNLSMLKSNSFTLLNN